eukprot:m.97245 g.97245  ORF g.97245 m.97245 type:complete len:324 (-) comp15520_c0_seq1:761-1732(-)
MADSGAPEGSVKNLLDNKTLRWVFVGGKGGVGKTTCSSSIAIQLAKVRRNVLLVSTDPAHNLSDAFNQKFGKDPTKVNGFDNLYCMEVDPSDAMEGLASAEAAAVPGLNILKDLGSSLPGIDEATSFTKILKLVNTLDFDVTVFDTAPTGHTLRLLQLPQSFVKGINKMLELKGMFGGLLNQFAGAMGMGGGEMDFTAKAEQMKKDVETLSAQFKDHTLTTFVCVAIAEFLSLYETERLIQELSILELDVCNIIVNQLVVQPQGSHCELCASRRAIQGKYLKQIDELYNDFHITKVPLQTSEVRGPKGLSTFSELLVNPVKVE